MFSFIKALVGGATYATDPVGIGVTHLRQGIKRAGLTADDYPDALLRELSEYSHTFSQGMAKLSARDKPVTYFVQSLDATVIYLCQAASGRPPQVAEPVHVIFQRHGIKSSTT